MKSFKISEAVIRRLPIYLRFLNDLSQSGIQTVSSQDLGEKLDLNPAQIRKDLAYFGEFGRKGVGYNVDYLIEKIRQILKLDQPMNVALVGTGNLGRALCNYNLYQKDNMKIVAVFDSDEEKHGQYINHLTIRPMSEMDEMVKAFDITVGIITVPAQEAQSVADQFIAAGIRGILNFAPVVLKAHQGVRIHHVDFTAELLSLAYYMDNNPDRSEGASE